MKLYDKKFLIYGICMIKSFGQPVTIKTFEENSGVEQNHSRVLIRK